ncbi:hypothetical protein [Chitinophaga sp. S165]|uniref:hypothetical protein n=1 Tax=Chitinophaga sp. S165 TaxID=2135462 RepID=UPI000D7133E5|nr:hypothetical protein [Chitinophaga sp. S165]PWV56867.1 hypothetical protein C7475_1011385 [Chitinophaga sp. S165]
MFETLANLTGLRIDDSRMIEFMEKNGYKYPKKPFISNRSTDTTYWVENKKLGIDLLFSAQPYLENYPLVQGEKKGVFIPMLTNIRWYNNKSGTEFPLSLDFNHKFEALKEKLGEPTLKSSDISPVWLNDDGSESFYRWRIVLDNEKDIVWGLQFDDDQTIRDFMLGLKYESPVFELYYAMLYGKFETFQASQDNYKTTSLMFLQWAIERELVKTNDVTAAVTTAVKEGTSPVIEWVRVLNRGYILDDDFTAEQRFIRAYVKNLSGHDILYTRDFAHLFLETAELRENYFSEAARKQLNAIAYNEENYGKVKSLIDKRLAEYQQHKFSQSKQL